MSIPFENLSIHCGEKIFMELELIFDKIVNRTRGGWCLENNFLFSWALQKMGYKTEILAAWVYSDTIEDFGLLDAHLINKVDIDGKLYIVDVSFGASSQIWEPLELVSGKEQSQLPGVFRLLDKGEMWVLVKTGRKPKVTDPAFAKSKLLDANLTKTIYCFTLEPRGQEYFNKACHILQTDPSSLFTNKSICSLQTPTGFKALIGWTYSEITYRPEEGVDVYEMKNITDEEIEPILMKEFNIRLPKKLQPINKKACFTL